MNDIELVTKAKLMRGELAGYAITPSGSIYSLKTDAWINVYDGPFNTKQVTIKGKTRYVHRLVADAYVEKPSDRHTRVSFVDGNKSNVCPENLRWVTPTECRGFDALNKNDIIFIKKEFASSGTSKSKTERYQQVTDIFNDQVGKRTSLSTVRTVIEANGIYEEHKDLSPYKVSIGDLVEVSNTKLKTYGQVGRIIGFDLYDDVLFVNLENGNQIRTKEHNLEHLNETLVEVVE